MKLENILKNKDKYVIELLERNGELNIENRKLKEEKQAQINNQETNLSGEVLKVKASLSLLYRDVLLLKQSNASQVNILISNGKYLKLESIWWATKYHKEYQKPKGLYKLNMMYEARGGVADAIHTNVVLSRTFFKLGK